MNKSTKSPSLRQDISRKYKRQKDAFTLHVAVEATDETFSLNNCYNDMTVLQLKDELEFTTGVPLSIQRLSFLDEDDLQDHTDLRSNEFVPGGTIRLKVWHVYRELLQAVVANDIDAVFTLGVTNLCDYHTPISDYMSKKTRQVWLEERAFIALCLAAHRGHEELVIKLIENGAEVNRQTSTGKTPLHLAAASGQGEVINTLLHHGADINAEDQHGNTTLSVAKRFGNKVCSRNLFQFQWQERAKAIKPSKKIPLFAHQYHDSSLPVWKRGSSAQIYVTKILKPGEYEGTALNAPKAGRHPSIIHKQLRNTTFFSDSPDSNASELGDYFPDECGSLPLVSKNKNITKMKRPLTYNEWLGKQKEIERRRALENRVENEEKRKKKQDEEEIKDEEEEEFGFETYLAQNELREKQETSAHQSSSNKNISIKSNVSPLVPAHPDGALRLYLRSLGKTSSGVSYEDWLDEKEMELNQLISQINTHAPH